MSKEDKLAYFREWAGYADCVRQSQRVNMERKLEHWASDSVLEEKQLLTSVFGPSTRIRSESLKGKSINQLIAGV